MVRNFRDVRRSIHNWAVSEVVINRVQCQRDDVSSRLARKTFPNSGADVHVRCMKLKPWTIANLNRDPSVDNVPKLLFHPLELTFGDDNGATYHESGRSRMRRIV